MNNFAITFFFKDIFTNDTDFREFLTDYTNLDSDDILHSVFFKYLYLEFCNSNVCYDMVEDFKRNFAITYEDVFDQFKYRKKVVDAQYALTLDEITELQKTISNIANNDSSVPNDPLNEIIDFVDQQTSTSLKDGKVASYLRALEVATTRYITEFIDRFRIHFLRIYPNSQEIY